MSSYCFKLALLCVTIALNGCWQCWYWYLNREKFKQILTTKYRFELLLQLHYETWDIDKTLSQIHIYSWEWGKAIQLNIQCKHSPISCQWSWLYNVVKISFSNNVIISGCIVLIVTFTWCLWNVIKHRHRHCFKITKVIIAHKRSNSTLLSGFS